MARAVLEVRGLWVGDGPDADVRDVGFRVGPGRVTGILGGPASGKSRLLRCIGLDYPPTAGEILLRGSSISGAAPERRRELRARQLELVHPPAPFGAPDPTVGTPRAGVLLGAARNRTLPVAGMRQRIQIAKALTNGADVLLLDEPFAGVEHGVRVRILELLERLRREVGTAVVVASRDPGTVRSLADEVLVLHDGVVCEQGPPDMVFGTPSHPQTRALLLDRRSA
ncbi:MAG: ATP-binding cassette domain-containing protein [Acidimicrobiales bacterium]